MFHFRTKETGLPKLKLTNSVALAVAFALTFSTTLAPSFAKEKEKPSAEESIARDTTDKRPKLIKEENGRLFLSKDDNDVLFTALSDEMKRTTDRMKLGTHGLPYFVQYKVLETEMLYLSAS